MQLALTEWHHDLTFTFVDYGTIQLPLAAGRGVDGIL